MIPREVVYRKEKLQTLCSYLCISPAGRFNIKLRYDHCLFNAVMVLPHDRVVLKNLLSSLDTFVYSVMLRKDICAGTLLKSWEHWKVKDNCCLKAT